MGRRKGSPPPRSAFQKGQSGNPSGKPKVPEDIRELMRNKTNEYKRKFFYWVDAPIDDVRLCQNAPWEVSAMDRMICSAVIQAMNGNIRAFECTLDRLIGKALQQVELSGQDGGPMQHSVTAQLVEKAIALAEHARKADALRS